MGYGKAVGNYFYVLGIAGIVFMVLEGVFADALFMDPSCVAMLVLAGGIRRGNNVYRKLAIALCLFYIVGALALTGAGFLGTGVKLQLWGPGKPFTPVAGVLIGVLFLLLFGLPLAGLMHPATKAAFQARSLKKSAGPNLSDPLSDGSESKTPRAE